MPDSKLFEENLNFWQDRYIKNNIGWHIEDVNPQLIKYLDLLASPTDASKSKTAIKKFFIPLCGKTKDIPYLLSLGYEVFGLEAVDSAIQQLDEENSLNLKFDEAQSLYYTEDRRLQIYCGDLFSCPIENWGPFDCVWDRGSFTAIDYPLRETYIKVMQRCLEAGHSTPAQPHIFRYLLQTVRYDKDVFDGPPKSTDEIDIETHFKSWMKITELEKVFVSDDNPMRNVSGNISSDFYEVFFLGENM